MIACGIDLSWVNTGIAMVERVTGCGDRLLYCQSIDNRAKGKVEEADQIERAARLYRGLEAALRSFNCQLCHVAYECPNSWAGGKTRERGMSTQALMLTGGAQAIFRAVIGGLRGVTAEQVHAINPNVWQRAMFDGLDELHMAREMVRAQYGTKYSDKRNGGMGSKEKSLFCAYEMFGVWPQTDHEADAICIARYTLDSYGRGGG